MKMKSVETLAIKYRPAKELLILDQSLLPEEVHWVPISHPEDMHSAIKDLKVRGANLIGISAAFSLAEYALTKPSETEIHKAGDKLKTARPTAIHLFSAVDRVLKETTATKRLEAAMSIYEEDKKACDQIAQRAEPLIQSGDQILTYCNAGSLATGGEGTALGVIKKAHKDNKNIHVYVCETRPVNQGSRLTFWELQKEQIPCTLICDNMIAGLMAQKKVDKAFVGADRISLKGDVANKTGTLSLAVVAQHFTVPFYVVAPESTFDRKCLSGQDIPIEQRSAQEISPFWADKAAIYNPSFDVTPSALITAIITEKEIIKSKA